MLATNYKYFNTDGQIYSGATQLYGVICTAVGDAATVIIKDGTATAGAVVCKLAAATASTSSVMFPTPISLRTGLYATVTGTAAYFTVLTDGFYSTTSTSTSTSTTTTSSSTSTSTSTSTTTS